MTIWSDITAAPKPLGKKPPSFHRWVIEAVSPAAEKPKTSTPMPIRIMPTIAVTLTMENQNSISPNSFTEIRLAAYSSTRNTSAVPHCGTPGSQNRT